MPNPPATTMAAASEVMKTLTMLAPWRGGSFGTSVSMLFTCDRKGCALIASGDLLDKGGMRVTLTARPLASDHLGEDPAHFLEGEGPQDLGARIAERAVLRG